MTTQTTHPSAQQVRDYLIERRAQNSPPPSPEVIKDKLNWHKLKTSDDLFRMIKDAVSRKPTVEELRKQRVSFIYGSLGGSSGITRDRIQNVLDMQDGKIAK